MLDQELKNGRYEIRAGDALQSHEPGDKLWIGHLTSGKDYASPATRERPEILPYGRIKKGR